MSLRLHALRINEIKLLQCFTKQHENVYPTCEYMRNIQFYRTHTLFYDYTQCDYMRIIRFLLDKFMFCTMTFPWEGKNLWIIYRTHILASIHLLLLTKRNTPQRRTPSLYQHRNPWVLPMLLISFLLWVFFGTKINKYLAPISHVLMTGLLCRSMPTIIKHETVSSDELQEGRFGTPSDASKWRHLSRFFNRFDTYLKRFQ